MRQQGRTLDETAEKQERQSNKIKKLKESRVKPANTNEKRGVKKPEKNVKKETVIRRQTTFTAPGGQLLFSLSAGRRNGIR